MAIDALQLVQLTALIIFSVNCLLVGALVMLKTVHRRRMRLHDLRRDRYIGVLSRHLAFENCTDPITVTMAEDPAFLDALIDIRNAVSGGEVSTLREIVKRHGVIARQVRRLESRFPLGRRLRAAVALAEIGDESSAAVLVRHLEDREPEIRIQSARGLARIQWTSAIDPIVWRFGAETPWVRARFSDALTGFGAKATWPLLAYVRINQRFETDGPALAIRTLAQIRDHEAVGPLLAVLEEATDLEIEIATVEALGELGSPEAIPALRSLLRSSRWELRTKAASAIGDLADGDSTGLLRGLLRDPEWWVRRAAAAAIAKLPEGIPMLYQALDDYDPFAADAAAEALTDAGELVSARRRSLDDESHEDPLLAHMAGGSLS